MAECEEQENHVRKVGKARECRNRVVARVGEDLRIRLDHCNDLSLRRYAIRSPLPTHLAPRKHAENVILRRSRRRIWRGSRGQILRGVPLRMTAASGFDKVAVYRRPLQMRRQPEDLPSWRLPRPGYISIWT